MVNQIVTAASFAVVTLLFFASLCNTQNFRFIHGVNEVYNRQCAHLQVNESRNVAKPADECDLYGYIMCFNRSAVAVGNCKGSVLQLRFNADKGYCDYYLNVPVPENCSPETVSAVANQERTCSDGSVTIGIAGTCAEYFSCTPSGPLRQPCPFQSYYINETAKCMYVMEPYVHDIPSADLQRCIASNPDQISMK